ncbi:hypothetical protein BMETH_3200_0 [methanotrophic bacterial endosymbiont of Bathymodiolus sp.]|nr:hypothetical protein BMETH_3200_0 [methanotrophic bacterial endosymbiont of Bathymodiolus sp.]
MQHLALKLTIGLYVIYLKFIIHSWFRNTMLGGDSKTLEC